jgi:hypothetical protein
MTVLRVGAELRGGGQSFSVGESEKLAAHPMRVPDG